MFSPGQLLHCAVNQLGNVICQSSVMESQSSARKMCSWRMVCFVKVDRYALCFSTIFACMNLHDLLYVDWRRNTGSVSFSTWHMASVNYPSFMSKLLFKAFSNSHFLLTDLEMIFNDFFFTVLLL